MKKKLLIIFSALCIISLFSSHANVYADKISLGVYPPLLKIKTPPGSTIKKNISITNYGDDPVNITIYIKPFTNSDKNNGEIKFITETDQIKNFFSDNVKVLDGTIPVNQLLIAPKEQRSLTLGITIPKTAKENDYYISILFVSNNTQKTKSNTSVISDGIGINVLLSILQQQPQDVGYIKSFTAPAFLNHTPVPISVAVANQGNHFFNIGGTITITNLFLRSKNIIQLQTANILSNSTRTITQKNNNPTAANILWSPKFLFGIYRADLDLATDNNTLVFHKSIYFYSYPVISFVILGFILIFLGIIIFKIRKK